VDLARLRVDRPHFAHDHAAHLLRRAVYLVATSQQTLRATTACLRHDRAPLVPGEPVTHGAVDLNGAECATPRGTLRALGALGALWPPLTGSPCRAGCPGCAGCALRAGWTL